MKVAGIDLSTFAVDIVTIDDDSGQVEWVRYPLNGSDAFDRTRTVAAVMPGRAHSFWNDIFAVGIEEPAGRNPGFAFRVQGSVIAMIPADKLVEKWMPSQWRKRVGLKGNATKADVYAFAAREHRPGYWGQRIPATSYTTEGYSGATGLVWPQDACDAYCIALATRGAIETEAAA